MYENGYGTEKDTAMAKAWYRSAVQQGLPEAALLLAELILQEEKGPARGEAAELLSRAAKDGFGPAQERLGLLYYSGDTVPRDLSKAFELFTEAADQDLPDAQYFLACMYSDGEASRSTRPRRSSCSARPPTTATPTLSSTSGWPTRRESASG
ncbi:hypothetical protein AUQ37_01430 [Candidatus Methanomethylophilus sp. 1R26]|nr:hypothetical protein AUQ37_01430 [Candidatus Methanomethylophilus sp. 1R26]